jgi:O-acetyl-ADP-ribose deacetylase (regulator of RNase III)
MISVVNADLITSQEEYIVQQCNCVATRPHGLSKTIADKFTCDPYSSRKKIGNRNMASEECRPNPGSFEVFESSENTPKIICLFAQYGMGKPYSYNNSYKQWEDSSASRLQWFKQGLRDIVKLQPRSLALPYKIGCGLAGGNWEKDYFPALKEFSENNPKIRIVLYKI